MSEAHIEGMKLAVKRARAIAAVAALMSSIEEIDGKLADLDAQMTAAERREIEGIVNDQENELADAVVSPGANDQQERTAA